MQDWDLGGPVSSIGGWLDFYSNGESITFEGGTVGLELAAVVAVLQLEGFRASPLF